MHQLWLGYICLHLLAQWNACVYSTLHRLNSHLVSLLTHHTMDSTALHMCQPVRFKGQEHGKNRDLPTQGGTLTTIG